MAGEHGDGAPELVAGGVGATDDHRLHHHHELAVAQTVTRLLGGDQRSEQVLCGAVAAVLDEPADVLVEVVLGLDDQRPVLGQVAVEDAQKIRRPDAEALPVLSRRAEQFADDRDGVRLTDVAHQVAASAGRHVVDQLLDHLAHEGTKAVGRLGRERRRHQPAEPGVVVSFGGEDRRALVAAHEHRIGDVLELRDEPHGGVEPSLAQHGHTILVTGQHVAELAADQPVLGAVLLEEGEARAAVGGERGDRGQVELVHGGGHVGTVPPRTLR